MSRNARNQGKRTFFISALAVPGLLLFNLHAYAVTNQNLYDEMHEPHESYAHGLPPE